MLEAQRDFLLRSLADLEAERAAGELPEKRYRDLHDQYTVEAATVLRAISRVQFLYADGVPAVAKRSRRRLYLPVAATVAVVLLGAGLLSRSLGERGQGATITGNAQSAAPELGALAQAAEDQPDDPKAQLDYAWALLQSDRPVDALRSFDTASRLDPNDPAPKAYSGWIVFLAGLIDEALPRLDAAIAADPSYPDAHFFRGMALLRGRDDRAGALTELREYLRLLPSSPQREEVQALIDELAQAQTPTPGP